MMLFKNPQSMYNLGAVSCLCVDNTGTLTENKMKVSQMYFNKNTVDF